MNRALALILIMVTRMADLLVRGIKGVLALAARTTVRVAIFLIRGIKGVPALAARTAVRLSGLFSLRGIVQRTLIMIVIVAICIAGFLSIRGVMPFMAVFGTSMEPELQAGDLILIEEVSTSDIEVGDIIVFTVPQAVREYYNYPQVVAHRVIEVRESEAGIAFRTKGDNTGEDPFSVRPQDLRGQASKQLSYLGFPLLFFQSQQGVIFIVIALLLLALYLYAGEIGQGRQIVHKSIFAPIIQENQQTSRALEQRMKTTEKGMLGTQQALNNFASAIAEYAEHLKSHTGAIQGLSEASQELKKGAAEQNKILARLVETMEEMGTKPEIEEVEPDVEVEVQFPPGCIRSRRRLTEEEDIFKAG